MRFYTIWPANREGAPTMAPAAWHQDRHWVVIDSTDGLSQLYVVEGPVSRWIALHRALEIREFAKRFDEEKKRSHLGIPQRGLSVNKPDAVPHLELPAIAGTARDPHRVCVTCKGRRFLIKSDGPNQAWLKCLACGERQPSDTPAV